MRAGGATRLALIALLCVWLAAAVSATAAPAAGAAPAPLGLGVVDDPLFVQSSPGVQASWLARAEGLGSRWVRIGVVWSAVAPYTRPRGFRADDPSSRAYNWSQLDQAVRAAVAHGQTPLLNVHQAPNWAEGPSPPSWAGTGAWEPSPSALGEFARALALRYSGRYPDPLARGRALPRVRYLQAWNEPNLLNYLAPQWVQDAHGHIAAWSPGRYRAMLNAFYGAVKRVAPGDVVFAAGTAPFGDAPGRDRMAPKTFLEGLFCLDGALRRTGCPGGVAHLDGLDHHVYSPPWEGALLPNDIGIPDLGRIWSVLNAARRQRTVAPNGPKQLWITEVGTGGGTSPAVEAQYLALDLYAFWSQHVSNVFWFSIQDPGAAAGAFFAYGGLYDGAGAPKPAAAAYRFPFVAVSAGANRVALWGKAPHGGVVIVQRLAGGRWRFAARLRAGSGGVFFGHVAARGRPQYRALLGGAVSPPWTVGTR